MTARWDPARERRPAPDDSWMSMEEIRSGSPSGEAFAFVLGAAALVLILLLATWIYDSHRPPHGTDPRNGPVDTLVHGRGTKVCDRDEADALTGVLLYESRGRTVAAVPNSPECQP